ncbi:MAG: single-stranded-DNA-specific exonuclease RecJ [Betaproteobacteria bacterium]|nr:single-stranded-DNA-specific exonuclease RecJ [Betaproteobacteria bacterium]
MRIVERRYADKDRQALIASGVHPVLARLFAARRIRSSAELDTSVERLIDPARLTHAAQAARLLADAIAADRKLLIVADYDADGATACALGVRALRAMGAKVDYLVPDRFVLGYGLSPELVDLAAQRAPDLLITVDNGIASIEGVARANELGIATLVTDHHLPGDALPAAAAIVNPNQPGCAFPSKALAGVGVMFYVMLALRAELRARGAFREGAGPNLGALTDLVALGTIADVVPLDANNRILVAQGLKRLRAGKAQAGLAALLRIAGRDPRAATSLDLGFIAGPRLNAAGRLADMGLGIECLITDDAARAANIAQQLERLNRERRAIEAGMLDEARAAAESLAARDTEPRAAYSFFEAGWHQGVVGIVASRLRERLHRPVVCFAPAAASADAGANAGLLRGSGRSVPGFHLRDCLDLVAKRSPGLILRFGGHAQAAGLTLREADLGRFTESFERAAAETASAEAFAAVLETDGELDPAYYTIDVARLLDEQIWGQGFPRPVFCDTFNVEAQRVVGERHLKLKLVKDGRRIEAMRFGSLDALPPRVRAAYRLTINEFNGMKSVQLNVEHFEAADAR